MELKTYLDKAITHLKKHPTEVRKESELLKQSQLSMKSLQEFTPQTPPVPRYLLTLTFM